MALNGTVLSLKQQRLISALISSPSVAEAARQAGVSLRQAHRYLEDPAFGEALKEAEGIALSGLLRGLVGLGEKAVQALSDALGPEQDIRLRLRAGDILLGRLVSYRDLIDLQERIEALESRMNVQR